MGAGVVFLALLGVFDAAMPVRALETLEFRSPGTDKALQADMIGASSLVSAKRDGVTAAQDYFAAARADYAQLLGALYANGYYSAVIHITLDGREAADIAPLNAPSRIDRVVIQIDPGPKFRYSRAQIAPLAPETTLPTGFAAGQVAKSGLVRQAVSEGIDGWRAIGHAKAEVDRQSITADHAAREVDVQLGLAPGPRLRFGPLSVRGNSKVRTDRILEIAGYPTGAIFDPEALALAGTRLRRTGAFKSVSFSDDAPVGPGDTLPVTVTVLEQAPRRLGFGAEIASLDGVSLDGYWLHRNLFGGAEQLRLDGSVTGIGGTAGGPDLSFGARFNRPATFTPDTALFLEARAEREDTEDFVANRGTLAAGLTRIFSDQLTGEIGVALSYERVTDDLGSYSLATLSVPVSVEWDRRDEPLNATSGTYLSADVTPFLGFADAGTGARLAIDARGYRAFGNDGRFVLAARAQAGAVLGAEVLETPTDFLFYSGGGGTVRGQPYQSLGVDTSCEGTRGGGPGCVIRTGGRSFLGLSGEVRASVGRKLGIVAFADAGFISADVFEGGDWHSGAGLGLRYATPIGPIRLDVAAPIGGDTGDGVQFYVGIGQSF